MDLELDDLILSSFYGFLCIQFSYCLYISHFEMVNPNGEDKNKRHLEEARSFLLPLNVEYI